MAAVVVAAVVVAAVVVAAVVVAAAVVRRSPQIGRQRRGIGGVTVPKMESNGDTDIVVSSGNLITGSG